jgi:predicted alpha/beta-fold hydrolase
MVRDGSSAAKDCDPTNDDLNVDSTLAEIPVQLPSRECLLEHPLNGSSAANVLTKQHDVCKTSHPMDGRCCTTPHCPPDSRDNAIQRIPSLWSSTTMTHASSATAATAVAMTVATTVAIAAGVVHWHEKRRQASLSVPPLIYGQIVLPSTTHGSAVMSRDSPTFHAATTTTTTSTTRTAAVDHDPHVLADIVQRMQQSWPHSVLQRPLIPTLYIGTRGTLSSIHSYLSSGPPTPPRDKVVCFTEVVTLPRDGAEIALDWQVPLSAVSTSNNSSHSGAPLSPNALEQLRWHVEQTTRHGPIPRPVVLILHGINNHAGFGYMRSLMAECHGRGWWAVGMNFRNCNAAAATTPQPSSSSSPRGYDGAFTGDVRSVVQILASRLATHRQPLLLVGNSLGANILVKYLGEEGYSETLPSCVAGAVTLANPMVIDARRMNPLWSAVLAIGAKQPLWNQWRQTRTNMQQPTLPLSSSLFRQCLHRAWRAVTLLDFDTAMSPLFVRNRTVYPYEYSIGYESPVDYWTEASSFRYAPFVSVPLLQLVARNDFLAAGPFRGRMAYSINNPNILVLETMSGGHLGWQEVPVVASNDNNPDSATSATNSASRGQWADAAMAEFFQAVLECRQERPLKIQPVPNADPIFSATNDMNITLRSRL